MKQEYEAMEVKVIRVNFQDVITESGCKQYGPR